MPPSHTITSRRPNAEEQRQIDQLCKPDVVSLGCLFSLLGFIPVTTGGLLLAIWLGWLPQPPKYLPWALGAAFLFFTPWCLKMYLHFVKDMRQHQRRATTGAKKNSVQVIEVANPRSVEVVPTGAASPCIAIDIGGGKLLYLQNQWLSDNRTYEAPRQRNDPADTFNGFPEPHAFPCERFTIARLPSSGDVLWIKPNGAYTEPERRVNALDEVHEHTADDSAFLDGDLDHLAEALGQLRTGPQQG